MDIKHGIFKNDTEQKYEAWKDGRLIGKISFVCKDSTITLWTKRCEEFLKSPDSYDLAGLKLSEEQKEVLRKLGIDARTALMLQDQKIEEQYNEFIKNIQG